MEYRELFKDDDPNLGVLDTKIVEKQTVRQEVIRKVDFESARLSNQWREEIIKKLDKDGTDKKQKDYDELLNCATAAAAVAMDFFL